MEVSVELRQKIIDLLTAIPNISDPQVRQALIHSAELDPQLRNQISFVSSSGAFFQLLLSTLIQYGRLNDGRHAIAAILEASKAFLGQDGRAYCDELINEITGSAIPKHGTQPTPTIKLIAPLIAIAKRFLEQVDARSTYKEGSPFLTIDSIVGQLQSYLPFPAIVADGQPTDKHVIELILEAKKLRIEHINYAGILFYQEPPNTLCRMKIAEVRFSENFILIPIPLSSIEKMILDKDLCIGLLTEYTNKYLPGANLFDDKNAITDTFSFFGRSGLIHLLAEMLRKKENIGLFGLRKSGKTSILHQLSFFLRQHPVVHIDLQIYEGKMLYGAEIFNQIILQLVKFIKIAQIVEGNFSTSVDDVNLFLESCPVHQASIKFSQQILELAEVLSDLGYNLPIVCLFDEIERIWPFPNAPSEKVEEFNGFFGGLRVLSQKYKNLSFLVADVHPDCNRVNQWPQKNVPTNPVYNFFNEIFIKPFSFDDTSTMLEDIGKLMDVGFDKETRLLIHRQSGGQPFLARQLASLLYKELPNNSHKSISVMNSREYLEDALIYSGFLIDYFDQNIWTDLQEHNNEAAMLILQNLSTSEGGLARKDIFSKLQGKCSKNTIVKTLVWLKDVGLITIEGDCFDIQIPLLSNWISMEFE